MKITNDSHMDHALTPAHVAYILETWGNVKVFTMDTVELPEGLPDLQYNLYGPVMGDDIIAENEVTYVKRGDRPGKTRIVGPQRFARPTRVLSVIMGPHMGETILYTAFGGPIAPREPFDPGLVPDSPAHVASIEFWSKHALCP